MVMTTTHYFLLSYSIQLLSDSAVPTLQPGHKKFNWCPLAPIVEDKRLIAFNGGEPFFIWHERFADSIPLGELVQTASRI